MKGLMKCAEASWLHATFDSPIPKNRDERIDHNIPSVIGAGIGGLAGAGLGALAGRKRYADSAVKATLIGGSTGAALGATAGHIFGNKKILDRRDAEGRPSTSAEEDEQKFKDWSGREYGKVG